MKNLARGLIVSLVFVVDAAVGAQSYIEGVRILGIRQYTGGTFGNCIAEVNVNINNAGTAQLNCTKPSLVSMGCDGSKFSKSEGAAFLTSAQLALVASRPVVMIVSDIEPYGGTTCTMVQMTVR